ncbi:hypothetical protein GGI43DRAFT_343807 [Trichoderma evansii]
MPFAFFSSTVTCLFFLNTYSEYKKLSREQGAIMLVLVTGYFILVLLYMGSNDLKKRMKKILIPIILKSVSFAKVIHILPFLHAMLPNSAYLYIKECYLNSRLAYGSYTPQV